MGQKGDIRDGPSQIWEMEQRQFDEAQTVSSINDTGITGHLHTYTQ